MRTVCVGIAIALACGACAGEAAASATVTSTGGGTQWTVQDDGTAETIAVDGVGALVPDPAQWRFTLTVGTFTNEPANCARVSANKVMECAAAAITRIVVNGYAGNDDISYALPTLADPNVALTVDGGAGDDDITATNLADALTGGVGADEIQGLGGEDGIAGSEDGDILIGGLAADNIDGGGGVDNIDGDDALSATPDGDDTIKGAAGNDIINGRGGSDTIDGGDDDDDITPGAGADGVVKGGTGTDRIRYDEPGRSAGVTVDLGAPGADGGPGDGTESADGIEDVTGTDFPDVLTGSDAANRLSGLDGNDALDGRLAADELVGGSGTDTVSYAVRTARVVSDLANNPGDGEAGENDEIRQAEVLIGGAGPDVLSGDGVANTLDGGPGDDVLTGNAGNDSITGGLGADMITAGAGADTVAALDGVVDTIDCGEDGDSVNADAGDVLAGCETVTPPRGSQSLPPPTVKRLRSSVVLSSRTRGTRTRIRSLSVRRIPAGARVIVRCTLPRSALRLRPRPCAFTRATITMRRAGTRSLTSRFKRRSLPAGTKVSVQITEASTIGETTTFTMRTRKAPLRKRTCATPAGRAVRC